MGKGVPAIWIGKEHGAELQEEEKSVWAIVFTGGI